VGSWTVEGVVKEARVKKLWEPSMPYLYRQTAEPDARSGVFYIRTVGDPGAVLKQVRAILLAFDPELDLSRLTTMRDALRETLGSQKFMVALLGLFAGCAVLLAVIGIYGVISYLVNQRTREIGIRMALGARRREILGSVIARAVRVTAVGAIAGCAAAALATRWLESLLYGISPTDTTVFAAVIGLTIAATIVACIGPAGRAVNVSPTEALRQE
jgi:ABC-type antimicrobial peptide transport system permease subunit